MQRRADKQFELEFDDRQPLLISRSPAQITVCDKSFIADPSGALHWPEQDTLIVADLHFEKGSAAARRGSLVPPYDTRATIDRLGVVLDRLDPGRVIALGDSFHDVEGPDRLHKDDLQGLHELQQTREWYWVAGNHDPVIPDAVGGRVCPAVTLDGIKFRHEPLEEPTGREIAGHLHPAAKLTRRGVAVRRKCFVSNGDRLVLPAFGAYTGGLNVLDDAFEPLFGAREFLVWMLGRNGVFPVSRRQLLGD